MLIFYCRNKAMQLWFIGHQRLEPQWNLDGWLSLIMVTMWILRTKMSISDSWNWVLKTMIMWDNVMRNIGSVPLNCIWLDQRQIKNMIWQQILEFMFKIYILSNLWYNEILLFYRNQSRWRSSSFASRNGTSRPW